MRGDTRSIPANATGAPVATVPTASPSSVQASSASTSAFVPYALLGLGILYFAWAWLEEKESIAKAIKPQNLRVNLLNLLKVVVMVIIGLGFLKLGLAKLVSWHVPGASFLLRLVAVA